MPTAKATDGLQVTVYNMLGYNNAPPTPTEDRKIYETVVPNIDFQWGGGGIFTNRSEDVVVKFEGTITSPITGDVIFYAPADDGVKLYIDGVDVINDWYDKGGGGSESQPIPFTANVSKTITLWYYENGGGAWVQLNWQLPGANMAIVPSTAFVYVDPAIEAARLEQERLAAEAAARAESERLAALEAARIEAERQAALAEEARLAELERQRIAAEQEAARQAAIAAQKAYEAEVARLAAIEAEKQRSIAAAKAAEEARLAAIEAEKKRIAEEEAKQKAEEEALEKWLAEKRLAFEEAEAKAKAEELARLAEEARIAQELKAKLEEEARLAAEAQAKAEAEAKAIADAKAAAIEAARVEAERAEAERIAKELATQIKPTPSPTPTKEPTPIPSPGISTEPSQTPVVIEPSPTTIPEVTIPEPVEPSPVSTPEPEVVILDEETNLEELAPDTPVELDNGVILTAETVIAVQLLQDPAEFLAEMFSDPLAAFSALGSVGADMTPEVREKSEKVVIAAVIAGNIATQAAATAGAVAAYRRKP